MNSRNKYVANLSAAWAAHKAPRATDAPTVVSLFAGCGGSSLGYSMAGYDERLAVEWDDAAAETFRLNFPGVSLHHGDIGSLPEADALRLAGLESGALDVLDGSPPCQGFSTAGKRNMDDSRNRLFLEYIRLLNAFRPKMFIMENVSGMVRGKMKLAFVEILRELKGCGYLVSARVMDSMYFGVPQSRKRIIFVGARQDTNCAPTHPAPQTSPVGLADAVELSVDALRGGWGARQFRSAQRRLAPLRLAPRRVSNGTGVVNRQFNNKFRGLDKPCVTLETGHPPILKLFGREREMGLLECSLVGSFPPEFVWGRDAYARIGNSVPPLFMRAIATHVRGLLKVAHGA